MDPNSNLDRLRATRNTGHERFRNGPVELTSDLAVFWQWAASDFVSNVTRAIVAEYIVSMALGCDLSGVCDEWAPHDLVTPAGTKVEVKAPSYLQSWHRTRVSAPSSSIRSSRASCADTNT